MFIGNILENTEYPTYWLYKVQSIGTNPFSNTADNYIKDYNVSASITTSTIIPPFGSIQLQPTASINILNYYDSSSGYLTFANTPNVPIVVSSSITLTAVSSTLVYFGFLNNNDPSTFLFSNIANIPIGTTTLKFSGLSGISIPDITFNLESKYLA